MFETAPRNFKMNPKTEDLLPSGEGLQNGMVVLVEDMRFSRIGDTYDKDNNWCLVSDITRPYHQDTNIISFVATYQDGHKCKRTYNKSYGWYYKLNENGEPLILDAEDFVFEPVEFPIEMTDLEPLVRVVATYDMMGDYSGPAWFSKVFDFHQENNNVVEARHLTSVDGPFGLVYVTFQLDLYLDGVNNAMDNVKEAATGKLCELVSDSDVHVHVAEIVSID